MILAPILNDMLKQLHSSDDNGVVQLAHPAVKFFWGRKPIPRTPLVYDAGIFILGQGHKVGYLGGQVFSYDKDTLLVVGAPIPLECETHATVHEPLLGIRIDLDTTLLYEMVGKLEGIPTCNECAGVSAAHLAVSPTPMSKEMLDATKRMLSILADPIDRKVLGNAAVNEVVYRVLRSEKGRVLFDLTQHQTPYAAVSRALNTIHQNYNEPLSVEELASETGMSLSSFHRAFKKVTGDSPLQYIKKIRLDKARGLLINSKKQVTVTAYEVGYDSASQFSREYKRYFKVPPSVDLQRALAAAG